MKKKATLLVTIVALLAVAVIGGTLAWFTSSDEAINTIKTGTIHIDLVEEHYTDKNDIMPGTVITKDPVIKNDGSNAAWVRYKVTPYIVDPETGVATTNPKLSVAGLTYKLGTTSVTLPTGWSDPVVLSGTNETVTGKATSLALFDKVEIPSAWGNDYQGQTIKIAVEVQAIQYDNNVDTAGNIIDNGSWLTAK